MSDKDFMKFKWYRFDENDPNYDFKVNTALILAIVFIIVLMYVVSKGLATS